MTTFSKIHSLLQPSDRRSALMLLALMIVGMLLETLGIGLVIPVIAILMQDNLAIRYPHIQPLLEWLGNPGQAQLISGALLSLIGIYFIKNLFLAFLAWQQTSFAFRVQVEISQRLFTIYLRQPYTFHLQRNSAKLLRNVVGEVGIFSTAITSMLTLITESLILLGITILLLVVEPLGTIIVVVLLGVMAWGFNRSTRSHILRWGKARQYHEGLRIQHVQQGLGGAKDVKLLGRETEFLARYHIHNAQSAKAARSQSTLQLMPRLWLELLAVTGMALLVQAMIAQGRDMGSIVPMLGLFAAAAFRLMPSINRILGASQSLRYAYVVVNTLHEEIKLSAVDTSSISGVGETLNFQEEIRLYNVSYSYPNALAHALSDVTISIRKGESIGFIGSSGSGKSTLIDVILGLLPPNQGSVVVDGRDIQENLRGWQDVIGYVPQTIYLTDDTLRCNVAFGLSNEQIDDAAVSRAIKDAQLEEFIAGLPLGVETVVGERGVRLSGGQRQRIGIARALYHNPSVLVLDEATSALDTATETEVMQAITALQGSKTILIVAHRLSTVEHCNRLYQLNQGVVTKEIPQANPHKGGQKKSELIEK